MHNIKSKIFKNNNKIALDITFKRQRYNLLHLLLYDTYISSHINIVNNIFNIKNKNGSGEIYRSGTKIIPDWLRVSMAHSELRTGMESPPPGIWTPHTDRRDGGRCPSQS